MKLSDLHIKLCEIGATLTERIESVHQDVRRINGQLQETIKEVAGLKERESAHMASVAEQEKVKTRAERRFDNLLYKVCLPAVAAALSALFVSFWTA